MSNQLWVRRTNSSDADSYNKFALATSNNLVDPDVFSYPRVLTLTAHTKEKPVVFMPMQTTLTLESLAINPDATTLEVAEGLRQLVKTAVYEADSNGIKEIYFVCRDESTSGFAARYFEELPYRTFRLKLNSIEAHDAMDSLSTPNQD